MSDSKYMRTTSLCVSLQNFIYDKTQFDKCLSEYSATVARHKEPEVMANCPAKLMAASVQATLGSLTKAKILQGSPASPGQAVV